jgi:uncharacterized protein
MRKALILVVILVGLVPIVAGFVGESIGGGLLHPMRRPLDRAMIAQADATFAQVGGTREDLEVNAPDGATLRGWKVRARAPNQDWVILFHGVSDNRIGALGHAAFLLRQGYSVVMMDSRAHGASGGPMATYGWAERQDTRALADALYASEQPRCLFALGESMGAAIALQSAALDSRIAGVVAESSFSNLREVSYDYAGLHLSPWLGKTIFRPASILALSRAEKEGGFDVGEISPEWAVGERAFPVFLICDARDSTIPCRHARRIYHAAAGPKELWVVPGAAHTAALGEAPAEFERRVVAFFTRMHASCRSASSSQNAELRTTRPAALK